MHVDLDRPDEVGGSGNERKGFKLSRARPHGLAQIRATATCRCLTLERQSAERGIACTAPGTTQWSTMASSPPEEEAPAAPELPLLSLDILQAIRTAQSQHGLRHGDYGRYRRDGACALVDWCRSCAAASQLTLSPAHRRQYCSRRLRRLYKGTKFLHGRGRFQKKKMEPAMVTDTRCGAT